jgi:hypothetical protein
VTSTTALPQQLAPAPPPSGDDRDRTTTTAVSAADNDSGGLSPSAKLWASIAVLLGIAALLGALTLLYFFHTRPRGEEDEGGLPDELVPVGVGAAVASETGAVRLLAPETTGAAETEVGPTNEAAGDGTDEAPVPPVVPVAATPDSTADGTAEPGDHSNAPVPETQPGDATEPPADMRQILADLIRKEEEGRIPPPPPSSPPTSPPDLSSNDG